MFKLLKNAQRAYEIKALELTIFIFHFSKVKEIKVI